MPEAAEFNFLEAFAQLLPDGLKSSLPVGLDNVGLQVLVYDPETGEVTDLTEESGRGFGNTSLRYA